MSYLTTCGRRCDLPGHQVQGGWGLSVSLYSTYVVCLATLPSPPCLRTEEGLDAWHRLP